MARKSRMSVMKRQRERKKAEKAAIKREERQQRESGANGDGTPVATSEDLEGYGVPVEGDEEPESSEGR